MWTVSAYSLQGTVTEVVPAIQKKRKKKEPEKERGTQRLRASPDAYQEEVKTCLSFGELTPSLGLSHVFPGSEGIGELR